MHQHTTNISFEYIDSSSHITPSHSNDSVTPISHHHVDESISTSPQEHFSHSHSPMGSLQSSSAHEYSHASPAPRRSTKARGPPPGLKDFVCPTQVKSTCPNAPTQSIVATEPTTAFPFDQSNSSVSFSTKSYPYPLFLISNLAHLSSHYMASLAKELQIPEPSLYAQAKQYSEWVKAMDQELHALETNGTWVLTNLSKGNKALSSKWFYKTK